MSYLSGEAVLWAIRSLKATTHPFLGITFLACKAHGLPVGSTDRLSLDALTKEHLLRHHRLDADSNFLFQPFASRQWWVKGNYASTGLQAVNTQTFGRVFLHERRSAEWGFVGDYVRRIKLRASSLGPGRIPLAAIAIWTAKGQDLPARTTVDVLVDLFLDRYNITTEERRLLFSRDGETPPDLDSLLRPESADLRSVVYQVALPPDVDEPPGVLMAIRMHGVGPAKEFRLKLGDRLTVIAGDNGLGKSLLLNAIWWASTGYWAELPAVPFQPQRAEEARIVNELRSEVGIRECEHHFYPPRHSWMQQNYHPQVPGLYIYAGLDGSFSVSDDHRGEVVDEGAMRFSASQVWDGNRRDMEGLMRDCVRWQTSEVDAFSLLEEVLACLSPGDLGVLKFGEPRRQPGDPRPIPVIRHPYGEVPVLYVSAGVRRALALAYMIVWAWMEHKWLSDFLEMKPVRRVVLIVDEVEAHLHPFWQRTMLPAILKIGEFLGDVDMQIVASTHSPLVLSSLEPHFRDSSDALYHLALEGDEVSLEQLEFRKYGDASSWLTAPAIGLQSARSPEAELAIQRAVELQLAGEAKKADVEAVSRELTRVLPADDGFWRRWTFFARRAGVAL